MGVDFAEAVEGHDAVAAAEAAAGRSSAAPPRPPD